MTPPGPEIQKNSSEIQKHLPRYPKIHRESQKTQNFQKKFFRNFVFRRRKKVGIFFRIFSDFVKIILLKFWNFFRFFCCLEKISDFLSRIFLEILFHNFVFRICFQLVFSEFVRKSETPPKLQLF